MKRKHSDVDDSTPAAAAAENVKGNGAGSESATFADMGLDPRLLQAVAEQGFQTPTLVQRKAVPLALNGKDVLAKAKTGSGKTAAYVLPILQAILRRKQSDSTPFTSALILVPTRELAEQVYQAVVAFGAFCAREASAAKLADARQADAVVRSLLAALPDVVVATPARALHAIETGMLNVDRLANLVLDEADLVMSYGYEEDLQKVAAALPKKGLQTVLTSATLSADVDTLKGIFCRDPVVLDLEEPEAEGEGVQQYVVRCGEDEKFLLVYVIFKLKLITGKCIIFVSDTDRCYRLKLFFEQFGIRSCVLNSELPVNSRIHTVEEFNRNVYDIIIASDENEVLGDEDDKADEEENGAEENGEGTAKTTKKQAKKDEDDDSRPSKKRKHRKRDKEYGVSRGIDFKNVATVVNFDLPTTSKSYTHRIGRTARAGQSGMALSFVIPSDQYRKHMPTSIPSTEFDEKVFARITKQQTKRGKEIKEYNFDMSQVDAFRYRMNDALRAVTKVAVREARTRELRAELVKSDKLKRHFAENPDELRHLRHDGELRAARTQAHLKHVPDYLLPAEGRKALTSEEVGFVPFRKGEKDKNRKKFFKKKSHHGLKGKPRRSDPLKTFKAGKGKRK